MSQTADGTVSLMFDCNIVETRTVKTYWQHTIQLISKIESLNLSMSSVPGESVGVSKANPTKTMKVETQSEFAHRPHVFDPSTQTSFAVKW